MSDPFQPCGEPMIHFNAFCHMLDSLRESYYKYLCIPGLHNLPMHYQDFFENFMHTDIPNFPYKDVVVSRFYDQNVARVYVNGHLCRATRPPGTQAGCKSSVHGLRTSERHTNHASLESLAVAQYLEIVSLKNENFDMMQQMASQSQKWEQFGPSDLDFLDLFC